MMVLRRFIVSTLFVIAFLIALDSKTVPPGEPKRLIEAAPSGAIAPAPVNPDFRQPRQAQGVTGWRVTGGKASAAREDNKTFAFLDQDNTTLTSSAFTLGSQTKSFTFEYRFTPPATTNGILRVFVRSGSSFKTETLALEVRCPCEAGWQSAQVNVEKWTGQNIEVKFVRPAFSFSLATVSASAIAITNVAADLLQAKLGRHARSVHAGDPVDTSTGNLFLGPRRENRSASSGADIDLEDLVIPGKGPTLHFARYYNSQSPLDVGLGAGWSHTYSLSVYPVWQGSWNDRRVFYPDGSSAYFRATDASETSFTPPLGNYDVLTCSGSSCLLTTKAQTRYSTNGTQLSAIKDRNNNTLTVNRDASGKITSVTDQGGQYLTFTSSGHLISSITDALSRTLSFTYTLSSTGWYLLTQFRDVDWTDSFYGYNSSDKLTSVTTAGIQRVTNVYDSSNRVVEQRDALNDRTCFYYGAGYSTTTNCTGVSPQPSPGQTVAVNPRGYKTTYAFDVDFRTQSVTNHLGGVVSRTFDSNWNVTCVTNQLGNKTQLLYDAKGNVISVYDSLQSGVCTSPSGQATRFTYTALNDVDLAEDKLGRIIDLVYDASGNITTVLHEDSAGYTKKRECFTIGSGGLVTEAIQSTTLTDCTGNKAKFEYDGNGNLIAVVAPRFSSQPTPPKDVFTYDAGGRLLTAKNELNHTNTYTYDVQNRPLTAKDNLNNTTTYTYDARGNLKTVTDATGKVTTFNYDNADRLTSVVDAANGTTTYGYDANSNRTAVTNARGKTTTYTYDELDRLMQVRDPLNRATSYQYDAASRVTQRTDARGLVTKYFYDAINRLVRVEHWNGGNLVDQVTYAYDALGNRTQMVDPTGTTTYVYDALNRPTSVTFPGPKTVSYQYNNVGYRSRITYPGSQNVDYAYDAAGHLASVTDWLGRQTSYAFDNAGNMTLITLPAASNLTRSYSYDAADRLTNVTNKRGSTTLSSFAYTLNAVGERTTMVVDSSWIWTYAYDNLHRLTSWAAPGTGDTYTYDAVGNRLTKNGASYTYDDADQMLSAGGAGYGYDANGNQTSRVSGAVTASWDHENRLKQWTVGGSSGTYTYDGDGLRRSYTNTVYGSTFNYTWDVAGGLPKLLDGQQGLYVYGYDLLYTDTFGSPSYRLADGLGTTHQLAGVSGNELVRYTYEPFGGLIYQTQTNPNPMKFAGEQHDDLENYYYLRARYYDPAIGRFISRDPLGGGARSPYAYASNNPVNRVDPSGLSEIIDPAGFANYADYWMTYQGDKSAGDANEAASQAAYWGARALGWEAGLGITLTEFTDALAAAIAAGILNQSGVLALIYSPNPGWHIIKIECFFICENPPRPTPTPTPFTVPFILTPKPTSTPQPPRPTSTPYPPVDPNIPLGCNISPTLCGPGGPPELRPPPDPNLSNDPRYPFQ